MDWKQVRERVALPIVVDGRHCLDMAALEAAGFEYHCLGEASVAPKEVKT
jgi:hypothetical protein